MRAKKKEEGKEERKWADGRREAKVGGGMGKGRDGLVGLIWEEEKGKRKEKRKKMDFSF